MLLQDKEMHVEIEDESDKEHGDERRTQVSDRAEGRSIRGGRIIATNGFAVITPVDDYYDDHLQLDALPSPVTPPNDTQVVPRITGKRAESARASCGCYMRLFYTCPVQLYGPTLSSDDTFYCGVFYQYCCGVGILPEVVMKAMKIHAERDAALQPREGEMERDAV